MQLDVMPVQTELPALITTSAMCVAVIQWLKNTKLVPFMDQHTAAINRTVAWMAAMISAAGIHYTWDAATATLTITGLHASTIIHAAADVTKNYAFQWLIYKGIVKGPAADVAAVQEGVPVAAVAPAGVVASAKEVQGKQAGG